MHHLNVLTQKQSLVQITAKSLAMPRIPQMLFIHRRITVRHQQIVVQTAVQLK